jgi:hypothetical protein
MTSTISPSTAAALLAKSSCSGLPAAAKRNIANTMMQAIAISPADIAGLTVPMSRSAETVAIQGGITFHIIMFSTVKTAFDVAVIRLVSIPGKRSEK